jgi:hypothetical protein
VEPLVALWDPEFWRKVPLSLQHHLCPLLLHLLVRYGGGRRELVVTVTVVHIPSVAARNRRGTPKKTTTMIEPTTCLSRLEWQ